MFDFLLESRIAFAHYSPQDVCATAHALGLLYRQLQYRVPEDWLAALLARAKASLADYSASAVAGLMVSLSNLKHPINPSFLSQLVHHLLDRIADAQQSDIANICWSLSVSWQDHAARAWLQQNMGLVHALATASFPLLSVSNHIDLQHLLGSFSTMGHHPGEAWLQAHEQRCVLVLPEFTGKALGDLLRAYHALEYTPSDAFYTALKQEKLRRQQQMQQQVMQMELLKQQHAQQQQQIEVLQQQQQQQQTQCGH